MCKFEKNLITTDADLPIAASVYAIVNTRNELVIEYIFEDDQKPWSNFKKLAIVDKDDTIKLANYYNVEMEHLPQFFYDECGIPYDSVPSQAEKIFKESLEIILESGAQYKFKEAI